MTIALTRWLRDRVYGPSRDRPNCEVEEKLEQTARELKEQLAPYLNKPDPLRALMQDLLLKRRKAIKGRYNGQRDH